MCGIIGIIGDEPVAPLLLKALSRLEYRGYDSAGIATIEPGGGIERRRHEGKLKNLFAVLENDPVQGTTGIGHTRWATHGAPTTGNAHPHATDKVAVVHNGIIENYRLLRQELIAKGYSFQSETDTETVPVLLTSLLDDGWPIEQAIPKLLEKLEGAFALGIVLRDRPDIMIAARRHAPLLIGLDPKRTALGSDVTALAGLVESVLYLDDGEWAILKSGGAEIFDEQGKRVMRASEALEVSHDAVSKGGFNHFMEKEIFEQPEVLRRLLDAHSDNGAFTFPALPVDTSKLRRLRLIACGTSFYAAMTAKYWLESIARIPTEIDIASEFRYRDTPVLDPEEELAVFISQSGETADTLMAMRLLQKQGVKCLTVVNVMQSTMANEADMALPIHAGPEIGVASTKAFTAQLTVLACLTLHLAREAGRVDIAPYWQSLTRLPEVMEDALQMNKEAYAAATHLLHARDVLYIARGTSFPIAMEGALKFKEITYIHAEGYAAGELKHGPLALIDDDVPVIAIAPSDPWFPKTLSNIQEAASRGGKITLITDEKGRKACDGDNYQFLVMPEVDVFTAPIAYSIPVQMLAYHTAALRGTDVDQPRNLAKSVTVE